MRLILFLLLLLAPGYVQSQDTITYDSTTTRVITKVAGALGGDYVNGPFSQSRFWQPQGGMLIDGSNVMVMADTANQVIRQVNWGTQTTSLVAGNATIMGNCLDNTCPANSFKDGMGAAATFTMPYTVQMHHEMRYAFVADTRSNAIRKLNLYTSTVLSVLRNVGFPTDVVSWGTNLAFCDGQNNSIWIYTGVDSTKMAQTTGVWNTNTLLLLSGGNSPTQGLYVEGASAAARFWEPLGITYNPDSAVLYVADFRNRVIRSVNPSTGSTALMIGKQNQTASIVDGATAVAVLVGPTNLVYKDQAVYFSDRNPNTGDGAFRVWYVQTNQVRTLVGQATRQVGDGLVTSATVGASAIWGVVVKAGEWMGWTESDKNTLRLASATTTSGIALIPCPPGQYFVSAQASCQNCTNTIPFGTTYISGGTTNANNCPWQCPDPPKYMPFTCPEFTAAVTNGKLGTATVGSSGAQELVCNAGFEKAPNGTACQTCAANSYCTGLNFADTGKQACIANSISLAGSSAITACKCSPSYFGLDGVSCTICPANSYCIGDTDTATSCPGNATSPSGSNQSTACVCIAGYFGPNGGTCAQCTANFYCTGGPTAAACLANAISPIGSSVQTQCVCKPGYYGVAGGTCTQCRANTYCPGNQAVENACPANSNSPIGSDAIADCLCNPGYHGPAGGTCTQCAANNYCSGGVTAQTACQANSGSVPGSTNSSACLCNNGFRDLTQANVCTSCSQSACANGVYRTDCTVVAGAPDLDSVCSLPCTAPGANTTFTWTSGGGYDFTTYAGINNCSFTCNTNYFRVANGAPPPAFTCVACNQNAASCATGQYLNLAGCTAAGTVNSPCVSCTNKPANSAYTSYGTVNGNNCPWQCNLGFYSNQTHCIACSASPCELGFYRNQCIQGTNLVFGTNSGCILRCSSPNSDTGTGIVQQSFTWTSPGTYNSALFLGNNDCTMTCNFNGGTGYYTVTVTTCVKITERNGTCGTGFYTKAATTSTDTSCIACTNYPYNLQNMSFAREQDRFQSGINATVNTVFRWRSVGSVKDPYGLSGSTCEFQCFEGVNSINGFYFDSSRTFEMGQATGLFPISGTCNKCNSSACSVGNYRGVCQAVAHTDPGTCMTCIHNKINNSVAVNWYYQYPGQDTCQYACIQHFYQPVSTNKTAASTCSACATNPVAKGCANGFFLNRATMCTNNSDSTCQPCNTASILNGNWISTGFDDPNCANVNSRCNANYFANPPNTQGALTCNPCNQAFLSCPAGTYLPLCQAGSLANAVCTACSFVKPSNSSITNGITHGVDSCSYLCNAPSFFDAGANRCDACNTAFATCAVGMYLDACIPNNRTIRDPSAREATARQAECRACTYKPAAATYTTNGQTFNTSDSCQWTCPTGFRRVGTYQSGTCEQCFQGPCPVGQYPSGCATPASNGTSNAVCTACTNKDSVGQSEYVSNGTVTGLIGNNDCTWRCSLNFFGSTVGTGVRIAAGGGGQCRACNMSSCLAGTYRDTCGAGRTLDASCLACTPAPLFSTLGIATPYNVDNCALFCNEGWYRLPGARFCCSDNAYITSASLCTCSAGFRLGVSGQDGADCVP